MRTAAVVSAYISVLVSINKPLQYCPATMMQPCFRTMLRTISVGMSSYAHEHLTTTE